MQRSYRRVSARGGFTLLEILIVLAIIGVIAAMVVPKLIGQQVTSYIKATKLSIKGLENTLDAYAVDLGGSYPQDLSVLMAQYTDLGGVVHPALLDKVPVDAWQMPFNYELPASNGSVAMQRPKIWSNGPNRNNENGSGDDINNWADRVTP
jgi:general secretion pathway protein G